MLQTITDILGTPCILIGLFALVGLLLQRKGITDIISGTLKTIMGFIMINAGAGVIVGSLTIFGKMFNQAFHINGVIPSNEAMIALTQKTFGAQMALILLFGMLTNLLLARFTRWKYIFLTGHIALFMSGLLTVILTAGGLHGVLLVVIGSIILGVWMIVSPAMLQPTVRKITGSDEIAVGHCGSLGYFVSAKIGKLFGNKQKTTEDIKVPKQLEFLGDSTVSLSLTMSILFIIVALFAGPKQVEQTLSGGTNFLVFSLIQAITFAVGVFIVMAGVKMLIAEIIPAFKGIADKMVPNAKPALDCPTVFPYAPNAVIIGFIMSFIAGLVSMFLLPMLGLAMIVPGLVPHFFTGATAGVFGNATGGRRGAILGSFTNGLLISFAPALLLPLIGAYGSGTTTYGDIDFGVVGVILGYILKSFSF